MQYLLTNDKKIYLTENIKDNFKLMSKILRLVIRVK